MAKDRFATFLEALYRAPLRPELFRVVLEQLAAGEAFPQAALIQHRDEENSHRILAFCGDGITEGGRIYESDYWPFDEWTRRFPKKPLPGRVLRGQELWPERAFRRSLFFNEFLVKYDVSEMACISAHSGSTQFETLSVYRGPGDPPFSDAQIEKLARVAPHLETALTTRRRLIELESRNRQLEAAFHLARTAFVIVDRSARVALLNKAAEAVLARQEGLLLKNSVLQAHVLRENTRLHTLIANAASHDPEGRFPRGGSLLISRGAGRPLYVFISPMPDAAIGARGGAAIISISDCERKPGVSSSLLRELFHLTPAECRLTLALLGGQTLSECGDSLGVGRETVRSQIKSVLRKTGARRQSELLQILAALAQ